MMNKYIKRTTYWSSRNARNTLPKQHMTKGVGKPIQAEQFHNKDALQ